MLSQSNKSSDISSEMQGIKQANKRSSVVAIVSTALFLCVGFIGAHKYYDQRSTADMIGEEYAAAYPYESLLEDTGNIAMLEDQPKLEEDTGNIAMLEDAGGSQGGKLGGRKKRFCQRCALCDWEDPSPGCARSAEKCALCPGSGEELLMTEDTGNVEMIDEQMLLEDGLLEDHPRELTEDQPRLMEDTGNVELLEDQGMVGLDLDSGDGLLAEDTGNIEMLEDQPRLMEDQGMVGLDFDSEDGLLEDTGNIAMLEDRH